MKPSRSLFILLALVASGATSCASTAARGIRYAGGNGSNPSQAVIISGAGTEPQFRAAEEAWIRQTLPDALWESGNYIVGPCACHAVKVTLPDGTSQTVYFDMSSLGR